MLLLVVPYFFAEQYFQTSFIYMNVSISQDLFFPGHHILRRAKCQIQQKVYFVMVKQPFGLKQFFLSLSKLSFEISIRKKVRSKKHIIFFLADKISHLIKSMFRHG